MLFFDGREGRGMGDREKGRGKKKNKKIPRRTFDIFDADIASPFFFPLLPFPSFQIFDVRKTIPISGSRETGLRTENPYVKFLGRGRERDLFPFTDDYFRPPLSTITPLPPTLP